MLNYETFLTQLYVMIDDFCKQELLPMVKPGPAASLSRSEVMTLAIVGQWHWFSSERDFYRYADHNWRYAFPNLPNRAQLNRLMRQQTDAITAFMLHLAEQMGRNTALYEAFDSSGVATRDSKRRGNGWLPGLATYGKCTRLGFYEGFHLLISVMPIGVITGYGFGSGNTHDVKLAETFLAARHCSQERLACVGKAAVGDYLADKGFTSDQNQARWRQHYEANVITAPKSNSKTRKWPKSLRKWLAGHRQIVETVFDKLMNTFRLSKERPHELSGFQMRLAAKTALHNFCIYLNLQLGRKPLAFVDLISRG